MKAAALLEGLKIHIRFMRRRIFIVFLSLQILSFGIEVSQLVNDKLNLSLALAVPPSKDDQLQRIFDSFQKGKWPKLIDLSKDFLRSQPSGPEQELVLFWMLKAHYESQNWSEIFQVADQIILRNGPRKSDALYLKGCAYLAINKKELGLRQFKILIRDYKGSPASQKAWMKLRLEQPVKM